jgi:hypothetical protein
MESDFLHKNDTFTLQITLDRRNLRLNLKDNLLPNPPHFSLLSTVEPLVPSGAWAAVRYDLDQQPGGPCDRVECGGGDELRQYLWILGLNYPSVDN